MAHVTSKSYHNLQKRLDKSPQGAPSSDTLFKILELLFTEDEAELVSSLPLNFFTVKDAARIWKKSENQARKTLNTLAEKGLLLDMKNGRTQAYILAPTMAGFFEFSLMRTDGKFNQKLLSELFYQYINIEDEFMQEIGFLFPGIARVFVDEKTIIPKYNSVVLDYERASHVIKTASSISVGNCYCRHKMEHIGKGCKNPQDVCLTLNKSAESLIKHKIAKKISKKKALEILDRCVKLGLVQIGDMVQEKVNWICNCCSCCCEAICSYNKLGHTYNYGSNFVSKNNFDECSGCGICIKKCPVEAISLKKIDQGKYAEINPEKCFGCGVCVRFCPTKSLEMSRRSTTNFVPKDTFERLVINAINAGKLQNLIFSNQTLWTTLLLQRLIGIILNLGPTKFILANRQIQSKFLYIASKTKKYVLFDELLNEGIKPDYSHPELKKK